MCRLFGFRSVLQSRVHQSLIGADNALALQSERHPDGWGVAYYLAGAPHLVKSVKTALEDQLFQRVGGIVTAQTVIAHIRKATIGMNSTVNTHPFQHAFWTFAHNGNIKNFDQHRDALMIRVDPDLARYILGHTDSEVLFYLILTALKKRTNIYRRPRHMEVVSDAVKEALSWITDTCGPIHPDDAGDPSETYLTFLLTDGQLMLGTQAGKNLYFTTHKKMCPERDECPFFSESCETQKDSGQVNHLVFSSEPLSGDNIWRQMETRQIVGVDSSMNLHLTKW